MLGEPDIETDLEQQLTRYWKESKAYEEVKALQPRVTGISRGWKKSGYLSLAASLVLLLGLFYYLWGAGDVLGEKEKIYISTKKMYVLAYSNMYSMTSIIYNSVFFIIIISIIQKEKNSLKNDEKNGSSLVPLSFSC